MDKLFIMRSRHYEIKFQIYWLSLSADKLKSIHYSFALTPEHSTTPAVSILSISADLYPYSFRTSTVCSPISGPGLTHACAGVRERRGAGRGLSSPLESFAKEALSLLCGCELTWSSDNTGVTQASVPSKIRNQSACVLEAKRSEKIRRSSGQSEKLICGGNWSSSNFKPGREKHNNHNTCYWILFVTQKKYFFLFRKIKLAYISV